MASDPHAANHESSAEVRQPGPPSATRRGIAVEHRHVRRAANYLPLLRALLVLSRVLGRYSRLLATPFVTRLWFTPWRVPLTDRARAKQARWVADAELFQLPTRVGRVTGFVQGTGPVVLLVHGWGDTATTLGAFVDPLARAGYRVVGLDLPGHGGSAGGTCDLLKASQAIADVAAAFGGTYAVVAHSMGAHSVLLAMSEEGVTFERVVLLAPSVDLEQILETFAALFALPSRAVAALMRHIESKFGAEVWRRTRWDAAQHTFTMPALVIHDPSDPQVLFHGSRHLVEAWPGARLVRIEEVGHAAITRDVRAVRHAVDFVSTTPEASSR